MTEEKRSVGRPKTSEYSGDPIDLLKEYVAKLENIDITEDMYRFVGSEINTEANLKIYKEYLSKFRGSLSSNQFSKVPTRKNKPLCLLKLVTRLCQYKHLNEFKDGKRWTCIIIPGN